MDKNKCPILKIKKLLHFENDRISLHMKERKFDKKLRILRNPLHNVVFPALSS
jgi:hypothetical protein